MEISQAVLDNEEPMMFSQQVLEDAWDEVIKRYREDSKFHKIIIKGRGTALHVAVSRRLLPVVRSLVEEIEKFDDKSCLRMIYEDATPLHLAAYAGFTSICEIIIGKEGERRYLIQEKNANGETPLFWAVQQRRRIAFVYLRQFYPTDLNIVINCNNTSILHVAIEREMFDLAIMIMYYYEGLISMKDRYDITPLKVLATRTSAFESGTRLSWWKRILYYCFTISCHYTKCTMELHQEKVISKETTKNGEECYSQVNIPLYFNVAQLKKIYKIPNYTDFVFRWPIVSLLDLEEIRTIKKKHIYGGQLMKEFMKYPTLSYMGGGDDPVGDIEYDDEMKDDFQQFHEFINPTHEQGNSSLQDIKKIKNKEDSENIGVKDITFWAVEKSGIAEILEELNFKVPITSDKKGLLLIAMKNIKTDLSKEKGDVKDTAYLIAASHGIVEMMSELELRIKSVIYDTNSNNENALLLAVKNRQPHVIQWLSKNLGTEDFRNLNLRIDKNGNTMLHLAAYTSFQSENTWRISGTAMQLTWDIKWYEYIKELVPKHFNNKGNKEGKTPSEIFKEQHKELLKKSVEWLKDTTQSYSVVAALIAGVAFTTSSSIPGGNQPTGEPALKGQPAFEGFAISSLIGLYFSVTALIMFLSILTSRKEVEEFRLNLPVKLLFGLSSLFVSIVAMFVSFCAGDFFMLTEKYTKKGILFYFFVSVFMPVTFYAAVQFHLFVDLVKVIWKKVPPPSVKDVLQ